MKESDNNDELKVEDKRADVNVQEEQDNSSGVDTKGDKLEEKDTKGLICLGRTCHSSRTRCKLLLPWISIL